jgi:hypothetical protein
MRAKEFTINVPITITINGDEDPVVNANGQTDATELDQNPVMVTPQQQELELAKAAAGKSSPVIDKLTQATPEIGAETEKPDEVGAGSEQDNQELQRLQALIAR